MNTIWKGVLGVVLVAAVGSGAAIGTSTYMMKHQQYAVSGDSISNVFSQPVRMVNYASVAAENTDFTAGVVPVHIRRRIALGIAELLRQGCDYLN